MTLQAKTSALDAVVCIPTFRRPDHLRKTLRSLIQQTGDVRFAVVIVDNDASRTEGETVAREILA